MAIIKCKMCGGDLELTEGSTVCECEYCGTRQTVPKADDEKKLTLFSRAGRLLRGCEFDKAAGVFETIVADFPEEAEAYWGLVLCKYGIEYVDDPATGKKIPTCHRSSFDNVLKDPNFEQACEFTDAVARRVYRDEARAIEELRQAILSVSGKEEPYDVFISYKEKDENGERTADSVLAQDIYRELTREGYRVFFSRISLENRLGTEYEPYIFAALNSAKVMIVVGTDYEHFDAVWVKNEWSRYLKLIAKGEKKTLIPVFRDMDAYDMPEEFNKLTALDMGKLGALQDLVHGVEKLVGKKKEETPAAQPVYVSGGPNVTALLKRGQQALEDGAWEKADGFYEQVLSMDAENSNAFLGKFCAQEKRANLDAAMDQRLLQSDFRENPQSLRIARQVEKEQSIVSANVLSGYLDGPKLSSLMPSRLDYPSAVEYRKNAKRSELDALRSDKLLTRARKFAKGELAMQIESSVSRFEQKLDDRIRKAEEQAEKEKLSRERVYADDLEKAARQAARLRQEAEARREDDYQALCRRQESARTLPEYQETLRLLSRAGMSNYKDCRERSQQCSEKIAELTEQERQAEEARQKLRAEKAEKLRLLKEKQKELTGKLKAEWDRQALQEKQERREYEEKYPEAGKKSEYLQQLNKLEEQQKETKRTSKGEKLLIGFAFLGLVEFIFGLLLEEGLIMVLGGFVFAVFGFFTYTVTFKGIIQDRKARRERTKQISSLCDALRRISAMPPFQPSRDDSEIQAIQQQIDTVKAEIESLQREKDV